MEKICYRKTFQSDKKTMKKIMTEIMDYLLHIFGNPSSQDIFELRLIFNELLANAVIHGNDSDSTKRVDISIEIESNRIYATIRDEGNGFDYRRQLKLRPTLSEEYLFSENGRGIKLVSELTDDLSFNKSGNEIKFFKKVNMYGQDSRC